MTHQFNKPSGFTLLEVMVAMVIFSIGMLGLAGIQGIALQNNATAYMRTIAMQQSYNMSDIIRANKATDGSIAPDFSSLTTTLITEPSKDCAVDNKTTNCTDSEMARYDIYHWQKKLERKLPSGKGKVTLTGSVYEITVMWDEERTGATGTACSADPDIDLKCYTIHIEA